MDKHPIEKGIEDVVRTYELLDRIRLRRDIVIRDDQFAREALFDAARAARAGGVRLSLVDTGRFEPSDVEWLAGEKVRFYTSDEARPREAELQRILLACRRARSFLAYFQNRPFSVESGPEKLSLAAIENLVSAGMDLHISNRTAARDVGVLADLAEGARERGAFLAYYHHGPLGADLAGLAARGAWVHFSDRSLSGAGAVELALETARSAREAGARAVLTVEKGLALPDLEGLFEAGAAVLFQTPPPDDASLLRPFERKARRRRLPARAFYLSTTFLP
jgi:hypothetical protein